MPVKKILKKVAPKKALSVYHYGMAILSAIVCRFPSRKMVVIGITGTKGKTSTANFIWACLNEAGLKTGLIGTANIRIGQEEILNKYHMTMPGRFKLQRLIRKMVKAGCKYLVMEVTSEGINQWRHKGINFDIVIFTNLTPEHLPSHGGSFENYKNAKGKLFDFLSKSRRKRIGGKLIKKMIIVNADSPHKDFFMQFGADIKKTFGISSEADTVAKNINDTYDGVEFFIDESKHELSIMGSFNVYNALPAVVIGSSLGIPLDTIQRGLKDLKLIPGRMEKIDEGQDFTVIVDYAHEKESMTAVLNTARKIVKDSGNQIIVLLGAEGGGRDKTKRPIMGEIAAKKSNYVIVSNVDPYEDDPVEILEDIAVEAEKHGKIRGENLFVIEDRREGIKKALSLAKKDDLVIITGKGAEQSIIICGISSEWDDRKVVREELRMIAGNS